MTVLSFAGVSRVYRSGETTVRALDDLTLDVAAGELVAIMTWRTGSRTSSPAASSSGWRWLAP